MDILILLVIAAVIIAIGMIAKTYYRTEAEQDKFWINSAEAHNSLLNKALKDIDKDNEELRALLNRNVTRFYPRLPFRTEGYTNFINMMKEQLQGNEGVPALISDKKAHAYDGCIILTYNFIMKIKRDGNEMDVSGKATRVWARDKNSSRFSLAHEHISFYG